MAINRLVEDAIESSLGLESRRRGRESVLIHNDRAKGRRSELAPSFKGATNDSRDRRQRAGVYLRLALSLIETELELRANIFALSRVTLSRFGSVCRLMPTAALN